MDLQPSTFGRREITGWGVEVRTQVRGARRRWKFVWVRLVRPGTDEQLCTSLRGARAWAEDYERRGVRARLVEVHRSRGRSYREPPAPPAPPQQLTLFA